MDTFDTGEEVMSEIDIEETEVDSGYNFEYVNNNQEHENTNEYETQIEEEGGEKSVENIENKNEDEKTDSLLQSMFESKGYDPKDWQVVGEFTGKFDFEKKESFDSSGKSTTEMFRELERNSPDNIYAKDHKGMNEHFASNPGEPYNLLDIISREENKEIIFSTSGIVDKDGVERFIVIKHEEIIKKEEKEKEPINKTEEQKEEELFLSLEIDLNKQETASKEKVENSLLTETLETQIENEQEIEVVESESNTNVLEPEINLTGTEEVVEKEEVVNVLNDVQHIEQNQEEKTDIIIDKTEQDKSINKEGIAENQEKVVDEKTINIEQPTIKIEEKVMTLEDRIRELLGYNDEPILAETAKTETSSVANERTEGPLIMEEIKDVENISEKVETPTNVAEVVITDKSEQAITEIVINEVFIENNTQEVNVKNEINITATEEDIDEKTIEAGKVSEKEMIEEVLVNTESQKEINETIQISNTESIQEQSKEQVETISTTEKIEVGVAQEKSEEKVKEDKENVENIKLDKETLNMNETREVLKDVKEVPEKIIIKQKVVEEKNTNKEEAVKTIEPEKVILRAEKITPKEIVLERKVVEIKEEKIGTIKTERVISQQKEAITLNFQRNEAVRTTARNERTTVAEIQKTEKIISNETKKPEPFQSYEVLLRSLGISTNIIMSNKIEIEDNRLVPTSNQEEQENKSTKSILNMYQQKKLNGITLKIAA